MIEPSRDNLRTIPWSLFSPKNACGALLPGGHFWQLKAVRGPLLGRTDFYVSWLRQSHVCACWCKHWKNRLISDLSTFSNLVMDHTYQIGGDKLIYSDCDQIAMQEHVTRSYSARDHIEVHATRARGGGHDVTSYRQFAHSDYIPRARCGWLYGLSHDRLLVFSTKLIRSSGKSKLVIMAHFTG